MTDDRGRTRRTLLVADHIWDALSAMAAEMGSDRDALVNQALYTFARLNGFLVPRDPGPVAVKTPPPPGDSLPPGLRLHRLHDEDAQTTAMDLPGTAAPAGPTLVLLSDGHEVDRVEKDRFVIGRGKHCDLVIDSGKVSREHAAIVREGAAWFIEDLGSSNGTWFEKERISRRQIHDGDEYFICSEKLGCAFR